jgi:hypothetical protein
MTAVRIYHPACVFSSKWRGSDPPTIPNGSKMATVDLPSSTPQVPQIYPQLKPVAFCLTGDSPRAPD